MTTVKTISAALKLVDSKKDNLRKALEELQAHSSSLSSFSLTWPDLDSHFTFLQSTLQHKFNLLETLEAEPQSTTPNPKEELTNPSSPLATEPVPARPELKSFCQKMDGLGLRGYIGVRPKERADIKLELVDAFRHASDASVMVLDAVEGFHPPNSKGDKDLELSSIRRSCIILLEELMTLRPEIDPEVKERAMKLAVTWKAKMRVVVDGDNPLEPLGFLHLVAAYGLVYGFNMGELIDCVVAVAKYRQAVKLCRAINFAERITDLIQKLLSNGKQLLAVKFIFEFKMTDKFPPVPLLKEHAEESKNLQRIRRGKHSRQQVNEAIAKEISALKSVVKCIDDYKLESQYPKGTLVKRIENLEKEMASRKRLAVAPASKSQQQSKPEKQSGNKRPRNTAAAGTATVPKSVPANSTVPPFQQGHRLTAGSLPDYHAPYLTSSAEPYVLAGSNPAIAPYTGSSAGPYGLSVASLGFSGNPSSNGASLYPSSGSHMPSGYYDRPVAYGGYESPPQYHPSYYPQ